MFIYYLKHPLFLLPITLSLRRTIFQSLIKNSSLWKIKELKINKRDFFEILINLK